MSSSTCGSPGLRYHTDVMSLASIRSPFCALIVPLPVVGSKLNVRARPKSVDRTNATIRPRSWSMPAKCAAWASPRSATIKIKPSLSLALQYGQETPAPTPGTEASEPRPPSSNERTTRRAPGPRASAIPRTLSDEHRAARRLFHDHACADHVRVGESSRASLGLDADDVSLAEGQAQPPGHEAHLSVSFGEDPSLKRKIGGRLFGGAASRSSQGARS